MATVKALTKRLQLWHIVDGNAEDLAELRGEKHTKSCAACEFHGPLDVDILRLPNDIECVCVVFTVKHPAFEEEVDVISFYYLNAVVVVWLEALYAAEK
jgi:hypothetical protein